MSIVSAIWKFKNDFRRSVGFDMIKRTEMRALGFGNTFVFDVAWSFLDAWGFLDAFHSIEIELHSNK